MKLTVEVPDKLISDQIRSALDFGIAYWADAFEPELSDIQDMHGRLIIGGVVTESEGSLCKRQEHTLDIERAVRLAIARYPHLLDPNQMDAETGDIFVQLAAFGTVKYG